MGKKATCSSLLHAATVRQSISILSFHLDGYLLGHHHPNQIKRVHEFVQFIPLISSSTPSQPLPLLVLLPIRPRAALPPILSNHCFEISAVPSNFASKVEWGLKRWEGCHRQGHRTMGRAGHHHDVWF